MHVIKITKILLTVSHYTDARRLVHKQGQPLSVLQETIQDITKSWKQQIEREKKTTNNIA